MAIGPNVAGSLLLSSLIGSFPSTVSPSVKYSSHPWIPSDPRTERSQCRLVVVVRPDIAIGAGLAPLDVLWFLIGKAIQTILDVLRKKGKAVLWFS